LKINNQLRCENYERSGSGFTLIEILVSAAIMVILAAGFLGLQYILSRNQVTAWSNYFAIESSNTAMSTLIRELRNAQPSGNGGYSLESLQDFEIIFYSDYDFDSHIERLRYTLTGSQFVKGIIEPVGDPAVYDPATEDVKVISDIIRNGANPVFYYYNSGWPQDTVNNPLLQIDRIADTRYVKLILKSNPNPNNSDFDYVLESDTRVRMLQDN